MERRHTTVATTLALVSALSLGATAVRADAVLDWNAIMVTTTAGNPFVQARLAHNYRSKRAVALDQVWGTEGLTLYQRPTNYVDASVSYDVTPDFTVYLQGSNLTNEYEDYYLQFPNQYGYQNIYERRLLLGVRARFGAAKR